MHGRVKVVLTVIVYACLTVALFVVRIFTSRPDANDRLDDD